jgi:hypothetical protein
MGFSFRDSAVITESHPIDWYDGLVTGLVRLRGQSEWFYVSLLAWSMRLEEKVFAVVAVTDEIAQRLIALLSKTAEGATEETWSAIQKEVARLRTEASGKARLIRCKEFGEPAAAEMEVELDELDLRDQLGQDIQSSLDEKQVKRWLGLEALQPVSDKR